MQPDGPPVRHERLIRYDRLVAPTEHLGVLVEPPADVLAAQLRRAASAGQGHLPESSAAGQRAQLLGRPLAEWRASLRARLGLRPENPVIATGHQPEFDHAGVFAKQIATRALAERAGPHAQGLFLIVDSDVPKRTTVRVAQVNAGAVRRVEVAIPGCEPLRTFEQQPPVQRSTWLQFFASLTSLHTGADRALLPAYARAWLTTDAPAPTYCDAWDRARVASEQALTKEIGADAMPSATRKTGAISGAQPGAMRKPGPAPSPCAECPTPGLGMPGALPSVRVSQLCRTPEFRAFVAHLLLDARGFADCYNAALEAYRRRHGVRARGRPVPPLMVGPELVELPLWAVRGDQPRRRVFVVRKEDQIEIHADGAHERVRGAAGGRTDGTGFTPIGRFTRDALHRAETLAQPWRLEPAGWSLRPRALALTAFLRLLVADLFVHGIGGAKYDEMTEDFVAAFFGVDPAPIACLSATLHLPLPRSTLRIEDLRRARRESRDLRHNPQRHVTNAPPDLLRERERLVRQSAELRTAQPRDHATRRLVFQSLKRVNERILETDPWRAAHYDQRAATIQTQLEADHLVLDREYFYALHPLDALSQLSSKLHHAIGRQ